MILHNRNNKNISSPLEGLVLQEKPTLDFKLNDAMLLRERQLDIKSEGRTIRIVFTLEEVFDRETWSSIKLEPQKGD